MVGGVHGYTLFTTGKRRAWNCRRRAGRRGGQGHREGRHAFLRGRRRLTRGRGELVLDAGAARMRASEDDAEVGYAERRALTSAGLSLDWLMRMSL